MKSNSILHYFLFIAFALLSWTLKAQCPPGNVVYLQTQAQVDAFLVDYPNCTNIPNYLQIGYLTGESSITDLSPLSNITTIGGTLAFHNVNSLSDLSGLSALTSVESILIDFSLNSLSGLDALTSVGDIEIYASRLTSLSGLEALTSLGNIYIHDNAFLTDLSGLENVDPTSITYVTLENNSQLSTCAVESICTYLGIETNGATISGNAAGCDSRMEVEMACVPQCPPSDVTFSNQAEVDAFVATYPNCTEIPGNLRIVSEDVSDLTGLSVITSIVGDLFISWNESLASLSGLDNINSVGGLLNVAYNDNLTSLSGLNNISTVGLGLTIQFNDNLTSLSDLANLNSVGADLRINWNESLTNLSGLHNLSSVGGDFDISRHDNLPSLVGLNNLSFIGGYLTIEENDNLISLNGLENLSSIEGIELINNMNLSSLSALNNLNAIGGDLYVFGNENLTSLSGLDNISSVGGSLVISSNESLTSLSPLSNLSSVGGFLSFSDNRLLEDFSGLDHITSISGGVSIYYHTNLTSLSGLQNITSIGGTLSISNNMNLTSLDGLANVSSIGGNFMLISNNPLLSDCAIMGICAYLEGDLDASFYSNAPGCNSPEEVEMACTPMIDGDLCGDALAIDNLLGQGIGVPQTSDLYDNTNNAATDTPAEGAECHFNEDPVTNSLWVSFTGDGNTYYLTTINCSEETYLDDTQMVLYSGDCNNLIPVDCNDDEDANLGLYNAELSIQTEAGVNYLLLLDGYGGSTGEFCLEVTRQEVVSTTELSSTNIRLFPNPVSDQLTIQLDGLPIGKGQLMVYNPQGQVVAQRSLNQTDSTWSTQLDLAALPASVYIIQLTTADSQLTRRVVKE